MPLIESDFYHALTVAAQEITKQITIMNKLKALELKRCDGFITSKMVDDIMED